MGIGQYAYLALFIIIWDGGSHASDASRASHPPRESWLRHFRIKFRINLQLGVNTKTHLWLSFVIFRTIIP